MTKPYLINISGLAEAVATARVSAKHKALLSALQSFDQLGDVQYATSRGGDGGTYLVRCKVLDHAGGLISGDRDQWLKEQFDAHGGRASAVYEAFKDSGYMVSKCELENLYFVVDRGGPQANFLQVEVDVQTEYVDRPLFDWFTHESARDLRDLQRDASSLSERKQLAPPVYALDKVVDIQLFMDAARAVHEGHRQHARRQVVEVTETTWDGKPAATYKSTFAAMDPDFEKFPWWRGERMVNDWTLSSAGRSGARLCKHWVMSIRDHQHPEDETTFSGTRSPLAGKRFMDFIPMWTHTFKMAEVTRAPSIHALYDKLLSIDRRTGVPFSWFFYMLHGNRVSDNAGNAVIKGAERGEVALHEHDYQVLRRWRDRPYGF